MSDLSNDTKKHTTKSRETIPLKAHLLTLLYCNPILPAITWVGVPAIGLAITAHLDPTLGSCGALWFRGAISWGEAVLITVVTHWPVISDLLDL
jgi:hypothetical protein